MACRCFLPTVLLTSTALALVTCAGTPSPPATATTRPEPTRAEPAPSDLKIVRAAARLLSDPAQWNARCDRSTPAPGEPSSLYAALATAAREVAGEHEHRRYALEHVRGIIDRVAGESFAHRLMDFNNSRSHGEVLALLAIAEAEIEELLLVRASGSRPAFPNLRKNAEIELVLRSIAREQPRWFRYGELGSTVQGRAIPYLHVRDFESEGERRGVWIDAGIHGFETACSEVVVGFGEHLAAGLAASSAEGAAVAFPWLDRVELFLVPVINVDGRAACMRPPYPVLRHNLAPVDDDGDGRIDEEPHVDLNGDGRISAMMTSGQEQVYESGDADGDGRFGEDLVGGVDLNRDFPVASRDRPEGWEPQPETQAVVDFWLAHPRIGLAVSYHTSRNMFIEPFFDLGEDESARYEELAEHFLAEFPGVYWRMYRNPDEYGAARPLTGMSVEWFRAARGAVAFILEIGTDAGPQGRGHVAETIALGDGRKATVFRIREGYYRTEENRLGAEIASQRRRHARYLTELVERFDRW